LGNAQGRRKPLQNMALPSLPSPLADQRSASGDGRGFFLVRPHLLGRWPRLVWTAPLVLKAFVMKLLRCLVVGVGAGARWLHCGGKHYTAIMVLLAMNKTLFRV